MAQIVHCSTQSYHEQIVLHNTTAAMKLRLLLCLHVALQTEGMDGTKPTASYTTGGCVPCNLCEMPPGGQHTYL
jgi:hypothetical protein